MDSCFVQHNFGAFAHRETRDAGAYDGKRDFSQYVFSGYALDNARCNPAGFGKSCGHQVAC
jgi:hypothetical protein